MSGDGRAADHRRHRRAGLAAEEMFRSACWRPHTARDAAALGDLDPTTLAIMHGSSFQGDGKRALYDLADAYERRFVAA